VRESVQARVPGQARAPAVEVAVAARRAVRAVERVAREVARVVRAAELEATPVRVDQEEGKDSQQPDPE
jgi:hypothetical protein